MFSPLLVRYGAVYRVFIASTIKYQFKSRKISRMTLLQFRFMIQLASGGVGHHEDPWPSVG